MNKEGRQVEDGVHNFRRIVWTNSNVFQSDKLIYDVQIMMNEILWDLNNTREVVSFIDDVIMEI